MREVLTVATLCLLCGGLLLILFVLASGATFSV
jgi:hypothetical protein